MKSLKDLFIHKLISTEDQHKNELKLQQQRHLQIVDQLRKEMQDFKLTVIQENKKLKEHLQNVISDQGNSMEIPSK